jgi:hypothetical protein
MTPTGFTSPEAYEHHIFKYIHIQQGKWIDEQSINRREYAHNIKRTILRKRFLWRIEHDLEQFKPECYGVAPI